MLLGVEVKKSVELFGIRVTTLGEACFVQVLDFYREGFTITGKMTKMMVAPRETV